MQTEGNSRGQMTQFFQEILIVIEKRCVCGYSLHNYFYLHGCLKFLMTKDLKELWKCMKFLAYTQNDSQRNDVT